MKKFITIILSVLLCVGVVGGVYVSTKDFKGKTNIETPNDNPGEEHPSDSNEEGENGKDTNNDSGDLGIGDANNDEVVEPEEEIPALKGLKIPEDEAAYIESRMKMTKGAQLYLVEGYREMRFRCNLTTDLYNEVKSDENKEIAILVFPTKYFDEVNENGYTYMDWITAFESAGKTDYIYLPYGDSNIGKAADSYYMRYKLCDIPYASINEKFTCLGVLKITDADGNVSYKYAELASGDTYQSAARSMSGLAGDSLNAYAIGEESFTEQQLTILKGFINESVDEANGLTESTNDGSTYSFTVDSTDTRMLSIGETFKLNVEIVPAENVRVRYYSTDKCVLTVDAQGNVTALKAGTAEILVCVAGETFSITVTVV